MEIQAAWELLATAGADPLAVARAAEVVKAFADARQLDAFVELSEQQPSVLDPVGQLVDPVPPEVACALAWSPWTASRRVDLAHDLHEVLPAVLDALRAGDIDLAKTQEIVVGTCELPPETRAVLAERAVGYAAGHTRGQLRAWLTRQLVRLDPETAEKRRKQANTQRRVWVQPESDGMATLGAHLSAEEAQACFEALRIGAANHEGGVDAARADLLIERLTGLSPATPIPVHVLMTPTGPELAGHGPISEAHAAKLCPPGTPRITLQTPPPSLTLRAHRGPDPVRDGPRPALPVPRLPPPRRALRPRPRHPLADR